MKLREKITSFFNREVKEDIEDFKPTELTDKEIDYINRGYTLYKDGEIIVSSEHTFKLDLHKKRNDNYTREYIDGYIQKQLMLDDVERDYINQGYNINSEVLSKYIMKSDVSIVRRFVRLGIERAIELQKIQNPDSK